MGLPGSLPPAGQFNPLGFAKGTPLQTMLQWREAELQHGRVSTLAVLGMLIVEEPIEYHPLFEAYNKDIGPAIRQLDEVDATSPYFLIGKSSTSFVCVKCDTIYVILICCVIDNPFYLIPTQASPPSSEALNTTVPSRVSPVQKEISPSNSYEKTITPATSVSIPWA